MPSLNWNLLKQLTKTYILSLINEMDSILLYKISMQCLGYLTINIPLIESESDEFGRPLTIREREILQLHKYTHPSSFPETTGFRCSTT